MSCRQRFILLIGFTLTLNIAVFAQSGSATPPQSGVGSGRIFSLYGDLRMIEVDGDAPSNTFFDLILYTRANEALGRQRVAKGGRFRFNNIPEDTYFLAVELDNVEIARLGIRVSQKKLDPIRQDLELEWTEAIRNKGGAAPTLNSYTRPNQNGALYERAMKEINKNELAKATATLRSIVDADPKDFPAWNELGMVYFIDKNFSAAETSYAKAIELRPDYISALVSLARVRLAQKNYEGAISVLESALKADPKSATAKYFLGEAYLLLKKGSIAVTYLTEAVKLDPVGMANAHLRLATLYHLGGYKDLAALEYNEFLKKRPDYPDAQRLRDYIVANGPRSRRSGEANPSPSPNPNP
jgi:tetratricopeptide (TPR) repeat protein